MRTFARVASCAILTALAGLPGAGAPGPAYPPEPASDIPRLVEALTRKGCAEDGDYRAIAGVSCTDARIASGTAEPDAVLQEIGQNEKKSIQALTLQSKKEDSACAQNAPSIGAAGTSVGPGTSDELVAALVKSAIEDAKGLALPVGLMLSIPGVTQIQYDYKGLTNGPEVRSFKIAGRVEGTVDEALLRLRMDGDVDGDKNLYVEYTVNYQKTKTPFPTWSPFLEAPGRVSRQFVRQQLDTLSATAEFSETGTQRNGVKVWHEYEYGWRAEKVGALPKDIVKQNGPELTALAKYPYGGYWVGTGWSSETRFKHTRRQFVGQFSPGLARTMKPEEGAEGVIMALNVKHKTTFYFHVDFDGNVSGRGTITYTLDPNLCAVAVLTRQVNERVNFLKYLPMIYTAARQLGELAVRRFSSAWMKEPTTITTKVDEFISKLPPKVEPAAGSQEVAQFLQAHARIGKGRNLAFADVEVAGFPKKRLWRPSGADDYPDIPDVAPVSKTTQFKTGDWAQEFKLTESGWDSMPGRSPFPRQLDSERMLLEYLAKELPRDASGVIRIYSRYPVCPKCTGVIEQFYWMFPKVTLLVTSGG